MIVLDPVHTHPDILQQKDVFKNLHSGDRFEKMRFKLPFWSVFTGYLRTVGLAGEKDLRFQTKRDTFERVTKIAKIITLVGNICRKQINLIVFSMVVIKAIKANTKMINCGHLSGYGPASMHFFRS